MSSFPATSPAIAWAALGVSRGFVQRGLAPVLDRFAQLHPVDLNGHPAEIEHDEAPWDLLFIGYEAPGTGTLEAQVRRVTRARPLEVVIAVAPVLSPARELELLRAGAVAALDPEAAPARVEQAIDQALNVLGSRRVGFERQKLRLINQLAISVNHEINNPLTGLMGTAELMLMKGRDLDEETRRDLRTIIDQARRIQEVTARLKTITQLRTVPYGSRDTMLDLVEAARPQPAAPPATVSDQFLPVPSILVVDDNPLMIDLIERLFENRFRIHAAGCASEALERLRQREYDLVLIDLILPEMNGLELFRAIRALRPRQRALLTTAYHDDPRAEQAIVEGALGCIAKPFQLEQLEEALVDALRDRVTGEKGDRVTGEKAP